MSDIGEYISDGACDPSVTITVGFDIGSEANIGRVRRILGPYGIMNTVIAITNKSDSSQDDLARAYVNAVSHVQEPADIASAYMAYLHFAGAIFKTPEYENDMPGKLEEFFDLVQETCGYSHELFSQETSRSSDRTTFRRAVTDPLRMFAVHYAWLATDAKRSFSGWLAPEVFRAFLDIYNRSEDPYIQSALFGLFELNRSQNYASHPDPVGAIFRVLARYKYDQLPLYHSELSSSDRYSTSIDLISKVLKNHSSEFFTEVADKPIFTTTKSKRYRKNLELIRQELSELECIDTIIDIGSGVLYPALRDWNEVWGPRIMNYFAVEPGFDCLPPDDIELNHFEHIKVGTQNGFLGVPEGQLARMKLLMPNAVVFMGNTMSPHFGDHTKMLIDILEYKPKVIIISGGFYIFKGPKGGEEMHVLVRNGDQSEKYRFVVFNPK